MAKKFDLSGFKLDMLPFFTIEAPKIIRSYKNLLNKKQGVRLDQAPSNKASTIKKKGKDHWFKDSGKTIQKGFDSIANKLKLVIFASKNRHTKARRKDPPTYEKLFQYHNTANNRYSGVFGSLPVGSKTLQRMNKEMTKQVQTFIFKKTPKRVIIGKK